MTDTICPRCKTRNSIDAKTVWNSKNCRVVGVISTVNVQCLKCNEIYMVPIRQNISFSKTELKGSSGTG